MIPPAACVGLLLLLAIFLEAIRVQMMRTHRYDPKDQLLHSVSVGRRVTVKRSGAEAVDAYTKSLRFDLKATPANGHPIFSETPALSAQQDPECRETDTPAAAIGAVAYKGPAQPLQPRALESGAHAPAGESEQSYYPHIAHNDVEQGTPPMSLSTPAPPQL